jgi:hypothetical protein
MRRLALVTFLSLAALPGFAMAQADGTPPPGDAMSGPPGMPPGPGHHGGWGMDHGPGHGGPGEFMDKFYDANTTHDDHLTLAQAKAADLKPVVKHFTEIDFAHRGYVTFDDVQAWHLEDMAKHLEKKAAELRAKDK